MNEKLKCKTFAHQHRSMYKAIMDVRTPVIDGLWVYPWFLAC